MNSTHDNRSFIIQKFNHAATTYDQASILTQEVGTRLLERLDWLQPLPTSLLDLGSGTGFFAENLATRFPEAALFNLDIAENMLAYAQQKRSSSTPLYVCANAEESPLQNHSMDFIFSNCTFEWFVAPFNALKEVKRMLKAQGFFLFSTFGPDTLKELKHILGKTNENILLKSFLDMHSIGDMLVQAGFQEPVLDRDIITLHYKSLKKFIKDLQSQGFYMLKSSEAYNLSKSTWRSFLNAYEDYRTSEGSFPATFEIIYGYAKAPHDASLYQADEDGVIRIPADQLPCL